MKKGKARAQQEAYGDDQNRSALRVFQIIPDLRRHDRKSEAGKQAHGNRSRDWTGRFLFFGHVEDSIRANRCGRIYLRGEKPNQGGPQSGVTIGETV